MKREYYYFDNSATSNPKPESVYERVNYALRELNANPGRGGHRLAIKSAMEIYNIREKISKFFGVDSSLNVAFTNNSTTALNFGIKSSVESGDIVVTSDIEHNSVLRPLYTTKECMDLDIKLLSSHSFIQEFKKLILQLKLENKKIKIVCLNHMSNVTGETLDITSIGKICRDNGILFLVDASQSAGILEIDMKMMNIDILCFTGHKSLYGIQGIGGICIREGIKLKPLLCGGTGSHSTALLHPTEMPDVVEGGTVNTPGIISLGAGIDFINSEGIEKIYKHENSLKTLFLKLLSEINTNNKISIYTNLGPNNGPVVSLNVEGIQSGELSQLLDEEFSIITRSGLHCAPLIHERFKTTHSGSVRFSFGYFNTEEDIIYAAKALEDILKFMEGR